MLREAGRALPERYGRSRAEGLNGFEDSCDRAVHASRRSILSVAIACFFLSGVAGLLYEVVWTRLLGLVFGHTVYAITTVLAAYMGGLALGSVLIGRRADRVERPLRMYGLLEGAIGLYCLGTPLLFRGADAAYLWAFHALRPSAAGSVAIHLLLSAALLLPPTTLMGATLPVLSRAVVGVGSLAAPRVGALYAVNTWGAVLGTVITGFGLLPALGMRATVWIGVGLNILVGALALLADRGGAEAPPAAGGAPGAVAGGGDAGPDACGRGRTAIALAAIAISGAASMTYQVAWTRALSLALGSSTYAFTAMLATFLIGLALGALVVSSVLRRRRAGLAAFAFVEIAVALVVALTLPVFGWLPEAVLLALGQIGVTHGSLVATQFGLSFAVMILPTLLIGATFPLLLAGLTREHARLGRDIGIVYGANTVGTILGSIAAGFLLIRTIGIQNTILVAATANLAVGLAVVAVAPEAGRRARALGLGAALAYVVIAVAIPRWDRNVMTSGPTVYAETLLRADDGLHELTSGRSLLFYDEGISTTVAVARDPSGTVLTVNGKGDASNDTDMATQLLLGHIGPALHPEARRALVVGLASGVTAGALAQHPLGVIDVAELEPAMREASQFFQRENRGVLADPRVRVLDGDGRAILATAAEPYDLIVSEPSNPWIAGVASLFTVDFYRAARERLAPGGVMVQWLQNYSIFARDLQMVVRTFQEVFPHVSVWAASPNDFILVATPEPLRVDIGAVEARLATSAGAREDFDRFGWRREGLVFRFFLGEEDVRRYAQGAPLNTDDRPLLEFSAPLALYGSSPDANERIMRSFRAVERPPVTGLDPALFEGTSGRLRAIEANWRSGHLAEAEHQLSLLGDRDALPPAQRAQLGRLLFVMGSFEAARVELSAVARVSPEEPVVRRYLRAVTAATTGAAAQQLAAGGLAWRGAIAGAFLQLARQHGDLDFYEIALEQMAVEQLTSPGSCVAANNYAGVMFELGRYQEAADSLRRAAALDPSVASTRFNLGLALEKLGREGEALASYEEASRLAPEWPNPRNRLAALRGEGGERR